MIFGDITARTELNTDSILRLRLSTNFLCQNGMLVTRHGRGRRILTDSLMGQTSASGAPRKTGRADMLGKSFPKIPLADNEGLPKGYAKDNKTEHTPKRPTVVRISGRPHMMVCCD